ncbi:unnamed protein product [Rodentolepis nana]|uniref:Mediator complex subunit 8 n=1 Tax=Rodentolepis nana TaxID=102285 RepID=A0A0R3TBQ4_RODNA|nr:unnamed protein product [Rodentolepis nana]
MSSEQTIREESLQGPPTDQAYVDLLKRMLEESGDSFAKMLPTLKLYMDGLSTNLMLMSTLVASNDMTNDIKLPVIRFLIDCKPFLDALAEVHPNIKIFRDALGFYEGMEVFTRREMRMPDIYILCHFSCIGYINYSRSSIPVYTNFVNNLRTGEWIVNHSSSVNVKATVIQFYAKYAREIRAISTFHESAMFAQMSCLMMKRMNVDNAIEENVSPEKLETVNYLRKLNESLANQDHQPAIHSIINDILTPTL